MSVNTGVNGCPLEKVGIPAVDRVREVGTDADAAATEALYVESIDLCGRVCVGREICLGINQSSDAEVDAMRQRIGLLEFAAKLGSGCKSTIG